MIKSKDILWNPKILKDNFDFGVRNQKSKPLLKFWIVFAEYRLDLMKDFGREGNWEGEVRVLRTKCCSSGCNREDNKRKFEKLTETFSLESKFADYCIFLMGKGRDENIKKFIYNAHIRKYNHAMFIQKLKIQQSSFHDKRN